MTTTNTPASGPPGPVVYLSYSSKDKEIAAAVTEALFDKGLRVLLDKASFFRGDNFQQAMNEALDSSDYMIALLTENSFSSSWVREELQHAFFDKRYKNRLLPVLIGEEDAPGFGRIPWFLTRLEYLNVPKSNSPVEIAEVVSKAVLKNLARESRSAQ